MFGIIRPCRNRLGDELRASWMAHLCGMCLALRDEHGQLARMVTNYDAVVISALVEAQAGSDGRRRTAGPCPLRGMRTASVAAGGGARLAASVSLLLASAKLTDHIADGDLDGALRVRATRAAAARLATAGSRSADPLGLDAGALLATVARQGDVETALSSILDVTAPTEAATALAFRQTALVAGRPGNADALAEAGRLFGRLAHLVDAVEDRAADQAAGTWNPITALGLGPDEVRRLCDDALLGIRLALRDAQFADARLVHVLLVHELKTAVDRAFGGPPAGSWTPPPQTPPSWTPPPPPQPGWPPPPTWPEAPEPPRKRGTIQGCLGWLVVCGTCQVCCAGEFVDPCTGQPRAGACRNNNCNCSGCSDCCDVCDCCSDCGDCCDCCDCCDCS